MVIANAMLLWKLVIHNTTLSVPVANEHLTTSMLFQIPLPEQHKRQVNHTMPITFVQVQVT